MIALRARLTQGRPHLMLAAVLGTLALAIAVEHSGVGHGELMADAMDGVASMCLAVVDAAGALLLGGLALAAAIRHGRREVNRSLSTAPLRVPESRPLANPPRAGPSLLGVFRR